MVKVNIKIQDFWVNSITITGHSNFAKKGEDIVCAGISAIIIGFFNALKTIGHDKDTELTVKEGFASIKVLKQTENLAVMIDTFIVQLKTIEKEYPEYIQIKGDDRYVI